MEPWSNISGNNTLAGFDYANDYYQVDAPAGCGQPEHSSSSSCWFMFQTQPAQSARGDCTSSLVKCWHAHREEFQSPVRWSCLAACWRRIHDIAFYLQYHSRHGVWSAHRGTRATSGHRLWRWVSDAWVEIATDGKYQVDRDIADGSYTFTYSLKLEFETPTLQGCEQFYFGTAATQPAEENGSC